MTDFDLQLATEAAATFQLPTISVTASVATLVPLLALGLAAGVMTTLAGMGGGLMLLLALAALRDPHEALAMTAPALLIGNAHRAFMFRAHLRPSVSGRLVAGALPGAILGGVWALSLPGEWLRGHGAGDAAGGGARDRLGARHLANGSARASGVRRGRGVRDVRRRGLPDRSGVAGGWPEGRGVCSYRCDGRRGDARWPVDRLQHG